MAKKHTTIGIEYDRGGIRGAKLVSEEIHGEWLSAVEAVEEVRGRFDDESALIEGLVSIRRELEAGSADSIVSCVGGKQVYVVQMPFRRLADEETRRALRFELRKKVPFEVAGSTIDFQALRTAQKAGENSELLVTVVANALLHHHLKVMEKAGMRPDMVDVLPAAAVNAARGAKPETAGGKSTAVIVHIGPEATTLVFHGEGPFFTRSFFFDAAGISDADPATLASGDTRESLSAFGQELLRSLSYYEKTYRIADLGELMVMGDYVAHPEIRRQVEGVGLPVRFGAPLPEGSGTKIPPGTFDMAIGLAARGARWGDAEMPHQINLVRLLRQEEKHQAARRRRLGLATFAALVLLGLSLAYSGWQIVHMEGVLSREREKLSRIESEYRQYTETEALIGDADIRLLDDLKNNSIFWTRKLAAIARHLPDGYATTGVAYDGKQLTIDGEGRVTSRQRQLIELHDYMSALRNDSTFSDEFGNVSLGSVKRGGRGDESLTFSMTAEK